MESEKLLYIWNKLGICQLFQQDEILIALAFCQNMKWNYILKFI